MVLNGSYRINVLKILKSWCNTFVNILLPHKCFACSAYVNENALCEECWGKLQFVNEPFCDKCGRPVALNLSDKIVCISCISRVKHFDRARSLLKFNYLSKLLIHGVKYGDKTHVAEFLSTILYSKYQKEINECDIIIPVPMHKFKRWLRLYNQAQVIAEFINKRARKKLSHTLMKSKFTRPQSTLTQKARFANLKNSFRVTDKKVVLNKHILLVDDVMTTGTTIDRCSKILKEAGAAKVTAITIIST